MTLTTPLCALLGLEVPIVLAPMAQVAGGRLAAAVSAAGGLGLIGGGYADPHWVETKWSAAGGAAVGIGFITWRLAQQPQVLARVLTWRPRAVLLSFGDIAPFVPAIAASGAVVIAQVQSVAQARAARAAGAHVIVAQGSEAGGHAGQRGTLALVPAVVDAVAPLPVLAAGGIADGRGIAAALMLGAAGVMLGSRFYGSTEALVHAAAQQALISASGDDTVRGDVFDLLRGWQWPAAYRLRTLANAMTARFPDRAELLPAVLPAARAEFTAALAAGDTRIAPVIVGEAADLITAIAPAAAIVATLMRETQTALRAAIQHLGG